MHAVELDVGLIFNVEKVHDVEDNSCEFETLQKRNTKKHGGFRHERTANANKCTFVYLFIA